MLHTWYATATININNTAVLRTLLFYVCAYECKNIFLLPSPLLPPFALFAAASLYVKQFKKIVGETKKEKKNPQQFAPGATHT